MTQQARDLLQKALSLSEEERADLACSLMESLDTAVDEGAESAWNEEIGRRITELDSGKAKTVPWEEVRRRISCKIAAGFFAAPKGATP
jgi:putative addiction module component (TIGR02574 family)